ncbi:hypothetical protein P280DRAFT_484724 [Massarina eburnea CBS 473.64]|uniref:CFEM domain-containing protein n=1 Tax=Massarina eburnea CBS 473.64 TaxID=1395130 RepID=A0A6A6RIJ1_9PLEO|nr:hypothetical protein P280DRAFT_484724 [Massarina eburnea CBS 473.64]
MRCGIFFSLGCSLVSLVAPVVAQAGLPSCAATCFQNALMAQEKCTPTDIPCICGDATLNANIQGCVLNTCTVREGLVTVNATSAMCGIPIRDRSHVLLISAIVSLIAAWIATTMRLTVGIVRESFGIDDVFALAACCAATPLSGLQFVTPALGFGRDTWGCTPTEISTVLKYVWGSQISYFPTSGFTKLCFLFFFLRIFPSQSTHRTIYVFIVITVLYTLGFTITVIFAAKPISTYWTSWDGEHPSIYSINQNVFYLTAAGVNIAIDFAIVIIPIPQLLKLKLTGRKRVFLMSIFSVGGVTIVVSLVRLSALATYGTTSNPMYDNMMSGVYSVIEGNVGVVCVCMPSFRRFLALFIPNCFDSEENSKYTPYDDDTPNKLSSSKPSRKKKSTLQGSLFQTTIMKTVDTRVETERHDSDDEVRLVDLQRNGRPAEGDHTGSLERHEPYKSPYTQHYPGN